MLSRRAYASRSQAPLRPLRQRTVLILRRPASEHRARLGRARHPQVGLRPPPGTATATAQRRNRGARRVCLPVGLGLGHHIEARPSARCLPHGCASSERSWEPAMGGGSHMECNRGWAKSKAWKSLERYCTFPITPVAGRNILGHDVKLELPQLDVECVRESPPPSPDTHFAAKVISSSVDCLLVSCQRATCSMSGAGLVSPPLYRIPEPPHRSAESMFQTSRES